MNGLPVAVLPIFVVGVAPLGGLAPLALVGAGGTAGAVARYAVARRVEGSHRGTLVVNVLGSAALGFLVAATADRRALLVVGTGFCGAFTTFSSFAVETVSLAEGGDRRPAVGYALGTLALALVAVAVGGVTGTAVRSFAR